MGEDEQTLPKLAVSAKLICLLMVVSCGTVTSMVRYVKLYNECAHSFLMIQNSGLVLADPDIHNSPYQNLTVISAGFSPNLTIYNRESRRYLCFTQKWRLFGSKRDRGEMCQFREELVKEGSYTRYRSAADPSYLVGFTRAGKAIQWWSRGRRLRPSQRCLSFIKMGEDIAAHHQLTNARVHGSVPENVAHALHPLRHRRRQRRPRV